jgi:DNA-binding NtrC family response regulator
MSRNTILFVDDEINILNSIRRELISADFTVITTSSGAEALSIMAQQEIDIVVSDIRMPEMDGIILLTKVKQKYPHITRIILSGHVKKDDVVNTISMGIATLYLVKPWDQLELILQRQLQIRSNSQFKIIQ